MTTDQPARRGGDIHRLLDEAFAGRTLTPDLQDLKEELRDSLLSRSAELEQAGVSPAVAARRAFDELGDVGEILDDADASGHAASASPNPNPNRTTVAEPAHIAVARHRVRPKPAFVVRTVLLSIAALAALATMLIGLTPLLGLETWVLIALAVLFGALLGVVTGDALRQETTTNHPMPATRAWTFGAATGVLLAALTAAPVVFLRLDPAWLTVPALAGIAAIAVLSYLGATQTNRHKPWVLRHQQATTPANRFEEDPAVAARFGIYTVVIWIVALIAVPIVGFTAGWWWALLPLLGGLAVMMLVLARMLFGHGRDAD
ncbi:hypothetical protein GE115_03140 [Agromyces sp. CFH 90414]|uniref:Uncharacterized protein n=1 Tax=Agromyces agglutinans TaxID=2662258 RepID=A0A6I2F7W8_9MICO|nr:permease prefix domain 1-containing protein [Agromyces agglutinans]MRG58870.1 hypothetical protein [Agromyces agglutinans]